jgi:hypothetical protein
MLPLLAILVLQQPGPVLPVGAAPHLSSLNLDIQRRLSEGDFAGAQAAMSTWPTGRLTFRADGLPQSYAHSPSAASALVKQASGSRVDFAPGSDAKVVFTFNALPPDGPKNPEFRDGAIHMEVPVTDRDGKPADPRSVTWSLAKGMAFAAGLDISTRFRSLMGAVIYTRSVADPTYSPREQALLSQIEDVRLELEKAIRDKTRLSPAIPIITVAPERVDLGTMTQGDRKEFEITIANTGNAAAVIEIETTCACIIAQPSFVLAAGETVTQKPRFDSTDYQGQLNKHLYVLSNSPSSPRRTVVMSGLIVPEVRFLAPTSSRTLQGVSGDGLHEVEVSDDGPTTLDLLFYGSTNPVELLDIQLGNPSASAQIVPFTGLVEDPMIGPGTRTGSKVKVTVPPAWPMGISWLRIVGVTTSRRRPSVEMTLQIRKGIAASPQSMYFGDAKVGQTSERTVTIEHLSKPFSITKIEAPSGIEATAKKLDDQGKRYQLTVSIRPATAGPISGVITLTTDSPKQPTLTVPIGGQAG